jgi:hypothetical protein
MPINTRIVEWVEGSYPDGLALQASEAEMYDIPAVGDVYWRGVEAYTVRAVSDGPEGVPDVHLEGNDEFGRLLNAGLPGGYHLHGGRSSNTGRWHFYVVDEQAGNPLIAQTMAESESLEQAAAQAVAQARPRLRQPP